MIEDPWAVLERKMSSSSSSSTAASQRVMSDSMIPQVGDSLLQRNQELNNATMETTLADESTDAAAVQDDTQ